MQPLLVIIAVMLRLLMVSEALSGEGSDDDDAPPQGCVVQKGNNAAVELNLETNLTTAVLQARCYSVCLKQVFVIALSMKIATVCSMLALA